MDRVSINDLPDDLLLKILSSLPLFEWKVAVRSSLLSKRWRDLWKLVPQLMFDDQSFDNSVSFVNFGRRSLKFNNNQALETLFLKLHRNYYGSNLDDLVQAAVDRSVRELGLDLRNTGCWLDGFLQLPSCLSTCKTLETLILSEVIIIGFDHQFRLPFLKTLSLSSVKFGPAKFLEDISVARILKICPVLEYLAVQKTKVFTIGVLSSTYRTLKALVLSELRIIGFKQYQFRLPFLKTLSLSSVKLRWDWDISLASLLQICPFLENLVLQKTEFFNFGQLSSTCRTLKKLILSELSINLSPQFFCLASLKILHLSLVKFSGDESVASLLKMCCVLERLVINRTKEDGVLIYNIDVPTLMSLSIRNSSIKNKKKKKSHRKRTYIPEPHGFMIKAPSLTELNFKDSTSNFLVFESMPDVTQANIEVICGQSENFIGSLPSIQHLSFCSLTSMTPYPKGTSFSSLEHLELCTCSEGWAKLLVCMLNDAPKVQSLKLKSKHNGTYNDLKNLWKEPKVVPKCLSEHLEILEWRQYEGKELENSVAEYILANATCLKMATFSTRYRNQKHRILMKLNSMDRVSKTCQLLFD